ncbi:MAG: hypothetical protein ACREEM_05030 [Blastocatellia bacterium]
MNILDENIGFTHREQLTAWKIHFRQIGFEIGAVGMEDRNQIIPLLHSLRRPTFFTRDHDFFYPNLRHAGYGLVYLDVEPNEAAEYIRRVLRHPSFRTQAQRMGKVLRVRHTGLSWWEGNAKVERALSW